MTLKPDAARTTGGPIVVIGLDAFDLDLLHRWSEEGRLPFLTSLMERGVVARLESTRDLFGDAPWPSVNTGVSPAKHAFYNHLQLKRGTLEIERIDARHCRQLPFWQYLKDTGLKVATLDVPKTFPIEGLDGTQVCGWGEHYPLLRTAVSIPSEAVTDRGQRRVILQKIRQFASYPTLIRVDLIRDWGRCRGRWHLVITGHDCADGSQLGIAILRRNRFVDTNECIDYRRVVHRS